MVTIRVLVCLVFFVVAGHRVASGAPSSSATTIGAGWRALPTSAAQWQKQEGTARVAFAAGTMVLSNVGPRSSMCTKARFGDFELEFEFQGTNVELATLVRGNSPTTAGGPMEGQRATLASASAWSLAKVSASQDAVRVSVNDVVVSDVRTHSTPAGFVCVSAQAKSDAAAGIARWRGFRIKELGRRGWLSLFDGRSLDGLASLRGTWRVKDGVLLGSPDPQGHWGAIRADLFADDVVAKVVYRLKHGNGGLYVRARPLADGPIGLAGVQADLDDDAKRNGGLFEVGGRAWVAKPQAGGLSPQPGAWTELVVSAHGGQIVSFINGRQAASFADDTAGATGVPALEVFGGKDALIEVKEFAVLGPVVPVIAGAPLGLCTNLKGDALAQTRDAGFDYAEIVATEVEAMTDDEFAAAEARVRAVALPVISAILFLPRDMKVVGPDAKPEVQNAYLDRLLPRLSKLGLRMVVFGSGKARQIPEGFAKAEATKQIVDFGKRAAARAQKHKMMIVVESLRTAETNHINTAEEALALVKAVNHPNFKMLVDYYHMALMKEDFAVIAKAGLRNIVHAQMANPAERRYPMSDDEGDYATFFEQLRRIGYKGGVSIEASAKNPSWDANRALRYLRRATSVLAPNLQK